LANCSFSLRANAEKTRQKLKTAVKTVVRNSLFILNNLP